MTDSILRKDHLLAFDVGIEDLYFVNVQAKEDMPEIDSDVPVVEVQEDLSPDQELPF